MVEIISETEARAALKTLRSEASNPHFYAAKRRNHGWLFVWRLERKNPPVGTRGWVVADNGRARILDLGERADDAMIAELAQDDTANE